MATEWEKAPQSVIDLATELIDLYHPTLQDARIGILFRSEAPISNGRATTGKASKVNAKWRPLLREDYDFIIWIAADYWFEYFDDKQRRALLDHELHHCYIDPEGRAQMRSHDVEEFASIIHRHGCWRDELQRFVDAANGQLRERDAVQAKLLKAPGRVDAIEVPSAIEFEEGDAVP